MRKYRKPYREHVKIQVAVKFVADALVAICLAYFIIISFGTRYSIIGNSMGDVLIHGDMVLIDKATFELRSPKRFEIVLFSPNGVNAGKTYVKRIIALPGEKIQIKDGKIFVNGMTLVNDVTDTQVLTPGLASEPITLGADEYFVMGDDRNNSEDSRFYTIGNIKEENIIGRPWLKVYPFSDFGWIE